MTLDELITRLEGAEAGSRELDCYIWVVAKGGDARMHYISDNSEFVWERGVDGMWIRAVERFKSVPLYTASVDAAISLAERLLPGAMWLIESGGDDDFGATITTADFKADSDWHKSTPAIALVLATLRALSKQEEQKL